MTRWYSQVRYRASRRIHVRRNRGSELLGGGVLCDPVRSSRPLCKKGICIAVKQNGYRKLVSTACPCPDRAGHSHRSHRTHLHIDKHRINLARICDTSRRLRIMVVDDRDIGTRKAGMNPINHRFTV